MYNIGIISCDGREHALKKLSLNTSIQLFYIEIILILD